MKKNLTKKSIIPSGNLIFRIMFLLFISINFQNANAQCSPDTLGPIPDVLNLPDVIGECSVNVTRPSAFDFCDNAVIPGTITANQLTYTIGTYTITWTYKDLTGNISSQTQKVIVNPLSAPVISADGPINFCQGDSVTLTSNSSTGNVWDNGTGTYTTNSITVKATGSYTLTVTINGCTASSVKNILVDDSIPVTPIITPQSSTTFCSGLNVILKSSSATGNKWTGGTTLDSLTVTTSGTYSVTVTNGCGLKRSLGTKVVVKPLTASITANGSTNICPGSSVILISNSTTGNYWTGGSTKDSLTVAPTAAKTYTLTLQNGCAVTTKATKTITLKPQTAKPTLAPMDTVCSTATTAPLPAGSPSGGTYSGNGVLPIINLFSPGFVGLLGFGPPSVIYTITDSLGCKNSVTQYVNIDTTCGKTTGINENELSQGTTIYPNPTNGLVNIVIKNVSFNQILISVVDVLGNEVFNANDKNSNTNYVKQINLESLANGIYYIKLSAGADSTIRKLIIQ